jgi:hypothetical protein
MRGKQLGDTTFRWGHRFPTPSSKDVAVAAALTAGERRRRRRAITTEIGKWSYGARAIPRAIPASEHRAFRMRCRQAVLLTELAAITAVEDGEIEGADGLEFADTAV